MSLGKILKDERERQGLSIDDVAKETHILEQMITELENDDFHRIAAEIYGRGFIKIYAKQLKMDPEPLLREFTAIFRKDGGISAVAPVPRVALERFGNHAGDGIEVVEPEPELKEAKTNEEKAAEAAGETEVAEGRKRRGRHQDDERQAPLLDLFAEKSARPEKAPETQPVEPDQPRQVPAPAPQASQPASAVSPPAAVPVAQTPQKSLFDVGSDDVPVITKSRNGVSMPSLAPLLSETSVLSRNRASSSDSSEAPVQSIRGSNKGTYSGVLDSASDHFSGHPFRPGFGRVFDSVLVSVLSGIAWFFVAMAKGIARCVKSVWKGVVFLVSGLCRGIVFCVRGLACGIVALFVALGRGLAAGGKAAGHGIGRGASALGSGLTNVAGTTARLPWGKIIKISLIIAVIAAVFVLISAGVRSCQASIRAAEEAEEAAGPVVHERLLDPPAGFAD